MVFSYLNFSSVNTGPISLKQFAYYLIIPVEFYAKEITAKAQLAQK
jgi:hypothetical protein